ncbi:hypothetical protein GW17_00062267 [Ensete ventricosum]|nr:hypothetical protein GW17_00062267 [Ensete ventricosum]RZS06687.1 hypothetical protein BHM03_00037384 [Ensete ventricosum]
MIEASTTLLASPWPAIGSSFACHSPYCRNNNLLLTMPEFVSVVRVAFLQDLGLEDALDQFNACYSVSWEAYFDRSFRVEYKREKKGWGDRSLPLYFHLRR